MITETLILKLDIPQASSSHFSARIYLFLANKFLKIIMRNSPELNDLDLYTLGLIPSKKTHSLKLQTLRYL